MNGTVSCIMHHVLACSLLPAAPVRSLLASYKSPRNRYRTRLLEKMRLTSFCHTTLCSTHFVIVGPRYHQADVPITTFFCLHQSHSKTSLWSCSAPCQWTMCTDRTASRCHPDFTVRTRRCRGLVYISLHFLLQPFNCGPAQSLVVPLFHFPDNYIVAATAAFAPVLISISRLILYPGLVCGPAVFFRRYHSYLEAGELEHGNKSD